MGQADDGDFALDIVDAAGIHLGFGDATCSLGTHHAHDAIAINHGPGGLPVVLEGRPCQCGALHRILQLAVKLAYLQREVIIGFAAHCRNEAAIGNIYGLHVTAAAQRGFHGLGHTIVHLEQVALIEGVELRQRGAAFLRVIVREVIHAEAIHALHQVTAIGLDLEGAGMAGFRERPH